MKVVLFCGGLGTRLRDLTEDIPKPLVRIGYRPILWHLMKYYAHFGHKDFVLCLGYRADKIKDYFLNYNEYLSNDFTMENGGKDLHVKGCDIADWRITFVDTGLRTNIGQRLRAVRKFLDGEELILANYSDGLTNLPLPDLVERFKRSGKIACFVCARPSQSFHIVTLTGDNLVGGISSVKESGLLINGGFFIFRKEIFDYIGPGEDLVEEPFRKLIKERQLVGYRHDQFWCMDTFKEHQELSDMYYAGNAPWEVWKQRADEAAAGQEPV